MPTIELLGVDVPILGYVVLDVNHHDFAVTFTGDDAQSEAEAYAEFNGCGAPMPLIEIETRIVHVPAEVD